MQLWQLSWLRDMSLLALTGAQAWFSNAPVVSGCSSLLKTEDGLAPGLSLFTGQKPLLAQVSQHWLISP